MSWWYAETDGGRGAWIEAGTTAGALKVARWEGRDRIYPAIVIDKVKIVQNGTEPIEVEPGDEE